MNVPRSVIPSWTKKQLTEVLEINKQSVPDCGARKQPLVDAVLALFDSQQSDVVPPQSDVPSGDQGQGAQMQALVNQVRALTEFKQAQEGYQAQQQNQQGYPSAVQQFTQGPSGPHQVKHGL